MNKELRVGICGLNAMAKKTSVKSTKVAKKAAAKIAAKAGKQRLTAPKAPSAVPELQLADYVSLIRPARCAGCSNAWPCSPDAASAQSGDAGEQSKVGDASARTQVLLTPGRARWLMTAPLNLLVLGCDYQKPRGDTLSPQPPR